MQSCFLVGGWYVEAPLNRISKGTEAVRLEPKVMALLVCLAEHAGEVVLREQLMQTLWPDTFVGDDQLNRGISELRKVFKDSPRQPRYIETIHKRGYRLIAPVHAVPSNQLRASKSAAPLQVPGTRQKKRYVFLGLALLAAFALISMLRHQAVPLDTDDLPGTAPVTIPLTSYPGQERTPAVSPDGKQVAYVWNGAEGEQFDLYIKAVGGAQHERITHTAANEYSPTWSPDDRQIAVFRFAGAACWIYLVAVVGGEERRLASCSASAQGLRWSPDGTRLVYAEQPAPQAPYRLVSLTLETLERRYLTSPPSSYHGDTFPAISPDGRWVAFSRNIYDKLGLLFRVSLDGGTPEQISTKHREIIGLDWTPDGDHLVFSTNVGGGHRLWEIPSTGGTPSGVDAAGWRLKRPALSRTGTLLIYENWIYDTNIWKVPLFSHHGVGPVSEPILASTLWDTHPSLSPDGEHIAFISTRSGSFEIWVSENDGASPEKVTNFGGPYVGPPRWAPDGQQLVFDARPEGPADLYVVHIAEKRPRRLTTGPDNELVPRWSNDGRWIYFASDQGSTWQVWKMPTAGGSASRVTHHGGFEAFESGDGTRLFYTKPGMSGIWEMRIGGREETVHLPELASDPWGNWMVRGQDLYVLDHTRDNRFPLLRYNTLTGKTTRIKELKGAPDNLGFSLSPDGQWVVYTRQDRAESDVMLVQNFR